MFYKNKQDNIPSPYSRCRTWSMMGKESGSVVSRRANIFKFSVIYTVLILRFQNRIPSGEAPTFSLSIRCQQLT